MARLSLNLSICVVYIAIAGSDRLCLDLKCQVYIWLDLVANAYNITDDLHIDGYPYISKC